MTTNPTGATPERPRLAIDLADDIATLGYMAEALTGLWDDIRQNIADASLAGLGFVPLPLGSFGPVRGMDWITSELAEAIARLEAKASGEGDKP
jgi:hypothetical protein